MSNNKEKFQNHLRQLFNECDIDKNGSLTRQEFRQLCSKIGFTQEAAEEAFQRLDCDRDDHISFEEFLAGFNQYQTSSSSTSSSSQQQHQQAQSRLQPPSDSEGRPQSRTSPRLSPVASRAALHRPPSAASPITLGGNVPARFHPSASQVAAFSSAPTMPAASTSSSGHENNSTGTYSSSSGTMSSSENFTSADSASYYAPYKSSKQGNGISSNEFNIIDTSIPTSSNNLNNNKNDDVVIYSSDLLTSQLDQATGSQYNSLLSQSAGGNVSASSLTQASCLNVQDLLDCVQKLQNENQQLSQIFFKDKRQREELISQLGEEFDQQVKQVEAAANKRAREELEAEKRRLREMMQEEREQLQHHYKTIERMSNLVKNVYEERKINPNAQVDSEGNLLINGATSIDIVKSQLEDTYEENKQLKRSLLDTKTDVARIWKEMGNLKSKYEEQLTSAHERNNETKTECDHIKRQLNLMKDSNRKLQDASDVITSYITDKVEPVIKIATESGVEVDLEDPSQQYRNSRLLMAGGGGASACNSRRGSVLSDYFGSGGGDGSDRTMPTSQGKQQALKFPKSDNDIEQAQKTDQLIAQEKKSQATLETPTQQAQSRSETKPRPNDVDDDDKDINDWLAQPQNSSPSSEPRSASILRRAALSRDGPRASSSSSGSSSIQPATNDITNHNDSTSQTKKTSTKSGSRVAFRHQRSQSIDLQSDIDELEATKGAKKGNAELGVKKQAEMSGPSLMTRTSPPVSATEEEGKLVCMVESADGPTVATYDIILVGDSFVGKSSLASRFIEGSYTRSVISTTSIDFKTKDCKVDGVNYTINLWDTAGQERFRSITASYFRKAKGIILMYDVTEKHTYLNIRNWMSTISNSAAESVAVLLLANKIDLRQVKGPERCVPAEEGERLAAEYGILFLETSVKSGTNLDSSMANLIRQMVKNCAPQNDSLDSGRIKLDSRTKSSCMPKSC